MKQGALRQEWEDYRTRHLSKASRAQVKKCREAFLCGIGAWQGLEAQLGSDEELLALQVEFVELVTEDLQHQFRSQGVAARLPAGR
jgi:hypothetical protein